MSILNKIIKKEEEDKVEDSKKAKTNVKAEAKKKAPVKKESKKSSGAKKETPAHYFDLILRPHISEKAFDINEDRKYVFVVARDANKIEIRKAVENFYKVSVSSVNIVKVPGKTKRYRGKLGKQSGFKKAIVTLKEGGKIDVMEATK